MKRSDFLTGIVASAAASVFPYKAKAKDEELSSSLPPLPKPDRIIPMWPNIHTAWNNHGIALYTMVRILDKETGKYYLSLHKQELRFPLVRNDFRNTDQMMRDLDYCHRRLHIEVYKSIHLGRRVDTKDNYGVDIYPFDTRQESEEERAKRMV